MAALFSVLCLIGLPNEEGGTDGRTYWAFRQLQQNEPPVVENGEWARTGIDRFVLARARAGGISPNGPVDRRKLIRRAYFDLIGLAPTRQEVEAFIADESPDAYEKILTRLLASPHYGERWGRHWLDVARFGESHGYEADNERQAQKRKYIFTNSGSVQKATTTPYYVKASAMLLFSMCNKKDANPGA